MLPGLWRRASHTRGPGGGRGHGRHRRYRSRRGRGPALGEVFHVSSVCCFGWSPVCAARYGSIQHLAAFYWPSTALILQVTQIEPTQIPALCSMIPRWIEALMTRSHSRSGRWAAAARAARRGRRRLARSAAVRPPKGRRGGGPAAACACPPHRCIPSPKVLWLGDM